jgi:hypothetical protein
MYLSEPALITINLTALLAAQFHTTPLSVAQHAARRTVLTALQQQSLQQDNRNAVTAAGRITSWRELVGLVLFIFKSAHDARACGNVKRTMGRQK